MSNEKVLAALFERIEINKSYYFEGAYYRKTMATTFMAYNGQFLVCVVKKQLPLASNFTGKMVSWTINSTLILKLVL